ncbi:MAG: hypothetical protein ACR2RA_03855 [Geminicoccaceae bacterium]
MESLLQALQATDVAQALRFSRFTYAAVSAVHILGIALLIGAILPLNLRLLGLWPDITRDTLIRVLVPSAAIGLFVAVLAGFFLFSIRATEYAALTVFRLKLLLVATGAASALLLHVRHGFLLQTASPTRLRIAAALSLLCWLGALVAGRLIAFTGD